MKNLKSLVFAVMIITTTITMLKAQNRKSATLSNQGIEKLLTERNFVFTTYFIGEESNGRPLLSPDYTLNISEKKLSAELPALTSYSSACFTSFAPYVKLNSTNYYYKVVAIDNVGWQVFIKPLNDRFVKGIMLNVNQKGYASLAVLDNKSKIMNYNGYITAKTPD